MSVVYMTKDAGSIHQEGGRLKSGETREVTFTLGGDAFSYYDVETEYLVPDNGSFRILVGPSSDDLSLQTDVNF